MNVQVYLYFNICCLGICFQIIGRCQKNSPAGNSTCLNKNTDGSLLYNFQGCHLHPTRVNFAGCILILALILALGVTRLEVTVLEPGSASPTPS